MVWPLISRNVNWCSWTKVVWSYRWRAGDQQLVVWACPGSPGARGGRRPSECACAGDETCTRNNFCVTPQAIVWTGDCRKVLAVPGLQVCSGTSFWTYGWHRRHWMFSHPHCQPLPLPEITAASSSCSDPAASLQRLNCESLALGSV